MCYKHFERFREEKIHFEHLNIPYGSHGTQRFCIFSGFNNMNIVYNILFKNINTYINFKTFINQVQKETLRLSLLKI